MRDYPELIDHAAQIVPKDAWGKYQLFFEARIASERIDPVVEETNALVA